jgi:hypothetical protein
VFGAAWKPGKLPVKVEILYYASFGGENDDNDRLILILIVMKRAAYACIKIYFI